MSNMSEASQPGPPPVGEKPGASISAPDTAKLAEVAEATEESRQSSADVVLDPDQPPRDRKEPVIGTASGQGAPSSDFRRIALTGYAVIALTFGGLGSWAALANIDAGVVAPGLISVQSKRQVVQHFEGGIVKEINVREGQEVREGELLFRLEDTSALANRDSVRHQAYAGLALEARLVAERDEAPAISFPAMLTDNPDDPVVKRVIGDETAQFRDRRASIQGQLGIISERIGQLHSELDGLERERKSAEQQLYFINDELQGIRELALKGLVPKSRQSALEREKARLDGVVGRNLADAAKAQNNIGEMNLQAQQIKQKFQEDVGSQLLDIRQKLGDLREKLNIAEDVLRRTEIRAPRSGEAQNVNPRIYTIGAVVKPGDTLLEIVPEDDELIVEAHVQVNDIDNLRGEASSEVRFPAFHSRTTPLILGRLRNVSRDRLVDETTHEPYYLAQVAVADTDIPEELRGRLRPGMPAEVIFNTGERTVMSYLVRPLTDALSKAFREH
jgi:HlyD family secretion protein